MQSSGAIPMLLVNRTAAACNSCVTPTSAPTSPPGPTTTCYHAVDTPDHKCFEACAKSKLIQYGCSGTCVDCMGKNLCLLVESAPYEPYEASDPEPLTLLRASPRASWERPPLDGHQVGAAAMYHSPTKFIYTKRGLVN